MNLTETQNFWAAYTVAINGYPHLRVAMVPELFTVEIFPAGTDGTVDANSAVADGNGTSKVAASITVAHLNNFDGSFKLQESIDGVNWANITGASVNLTSNTTFIIPTVSYSGRYVRGVYDSGTNTMVINYDNPLNGPFTAAENLVDGVTGANATVDSDDGISALEVTGVNGTFSNNDGMTGGTSGATADVNGTPLVPSYSASIFLKS